MNRYYLRPCGLIPVSNGRYLDENRHHPGQLLRLGDSSLDYSAIETIERSETTTSRRIWSIEQFLDHENYDNYHLRWRSLVDSRGVRGVLGGLSLLRPLVMGVLNVTPDSFSDGGLFFEPADAIAQGELMLEHGADIIDIGGESTRPGSKSVSVEEELRRVLPVVEHFCRWGAVVSIDSCKSQVLRAALDLGARIINDVSALTAETASLAVAADSDAQIILMHMQGKPQTMQRDPQYQDVALDVFDWLDDRITACREAGIDRERLFVDPGIGFGKTLEHNLELLIQASLFHSLGVMVVYGVSRKSFLSKIYPAREASKRLAGSLAVGWSLFDQGVQMVRVHDVLETVQVRAVWEALRLPCPSLSSSIVTNGINADSW